jgi:hypothetical protein
MVCNNLLKVLQQWSCRLMAQWESTQEYHPIKGYNSIFPLERILWLVADWQVSPYFMCWVANLGDITPWLLPPQQYCRRHSNLSILHKYFLNNFSNYGQDQKVNMNSDSVITYFLRK